jgi:hypothetical protein
MKLPERPKIRKPDYLLARRPGIVRKWHIMDFADKLPAAHAVVVRTRYLRGWQALR